MIVGYNLEYNTPLREVIQAHRDYWLSEAQQKENLKQTGDQVPETKSEDDSEYDKYVNVVPDIEILQLQGALSSSSVLPRERVTLL